MNVLEYAMGKRTKKHALHLFPSLSYYSSNLLQLCSILRMLHQSIVILLIIDSQIIPSLLDVFVGIEMTGQSVQFEQKFNYRRPMYNIMDYLWTLPEQREVFKWVPHISCFLLLNVQILLKNTFKPSSSNSVQGFGCWCRT